MEGMLEVFEIVYTKYSAALVMGSGLIAYFVDHKKMLKKNKQKEAKVSKYVGLTYIYGGIALYVVSIIL